MPFYSEIARHRSKLVGMRSSERNRYQSCMTVPDVGMGSVLSDCMGVTARAVMEDLASGEPFDEARVRGLIRGRAKAKADQIVDSVRDCSIDGAQRFKISESLAHMEFLDGAISACEAELRERLAPHWAAVELAQTVPGIGELSAMPAISETGGDMSVFEDADHLASWAGLAPGRNEGAGKKRSTRVAKAGRHLKPVLIQYAMAAVRSTEEGYFAAKYERVARRHGRKRAVVAVARMMLVCLCHMFLTGEVLGPSDYGELRSGEPVRERLTEDSALRLLRELGYDITAPGANG